MNYFKTIRYFAHAIGPLNSLKIFIGRLKRSELVQITSPSGLVKVRPFSTDPLMAYDVLWKSEYGFDYPINPRTIIDAGANIGCATRYFLDRYDTAKIVAIEPDQANFNILRANCKSSNNVVLINKALWPSQVDLQLDYSHNAECAVRTTNSKSPADPLNRVVFCETITPFQLVEDYGHIDILKLDIEGAEAALFSPANDLSWLESVTCIVIELHDRFESGCSRNFWSAVHGFPKEACNGENILVSRL